MLVLILMYFSRLVQILCKQHFKMLRFLTILVQFLTCLLRAFVVLGRGFNPFKAPGVFKRQIQRLYKQILNHIKIVELCYYIWNPNEKFIEIRTNVPVLVFFFI